MPTTIANGPSREEERILKNAHGTVMVIGWMVFASTGILFARYGRSLHIGNKQNFLGESIWFQVHRLILFLATMATLLGFLLILAEVNGEWIRSKEGLTFVHSVLGGIIVCCALLQASMALFRCHPDSTFRFVFNWCHRATGLLAFFLSIPTIFVIIVKWKANRAGLIVIMSLWSAWVLIIVVLLEIVRLYFSRISPIACSIETREYELANSNLPPTMTLQQAEAAHNRLPNNIILMLLFVHMIVAIALSIPLIVLIWR
ncbi:unnamed protein product [Rotaria magnacalcarata]|uniref:Cytochrome b561 domain-containing protein n=2 Tax=Rotaria magnacalcarata TaxID=392030 RepID=A0A819ALQ8_9BILA|nr:unnamed protein product [Rotaria magnacalcarata]CAF2061407.1 unnamed protein product [Rotaria magnacalcarata]CAF2118956.1 unnamed protein product [Rotaria magnacalcarata]CAF3779502.1 unnamed protein product [Rotaria magnacalcarata]CAF3922543.1 unnamed protein product [Rotaria magnacalcarata]